MFKPLPRRTFLKATGVSLALPLLESMGEAADKEQPAPHRMVFLCTALGLHPQSLWPSTPGKKYESTEYLELLKEHRSDFTLFSGLQHEDQTGRQPHDSEMTWLTAARKPGMSGFRNTISIDQVAAAHMGKTTRFPSITLGTFSGQSQSYTRNGVMIPAQTSPAKLFARLFLQGTPKEIQAQARRLEDGKSILDQLRSQTKDIRRKSSSADNHLLDDYFESLRKTESGITKQQGWLKKAKPKVEAPRPRDIFDHADVIGRARLLIDLVPLIVQTDSSRVVSIMIQDHYVVPKVAGVTGNHHNLSHHGQDKAKIKQLQKIETEIVGCFDRLLTKMKARREGDSHLLDRTAVLFGSNLGNANAHHANNLPIFLAGGGFQHGQYLAQKKGTPLCNLFLTMLANAGHETKSFAQSTGQLTW